MAWKDVWQHARAKINVCQLQPETGHYFDCTYRCHDQCNKTFWISMIRGWASPKAKKRSGEVDNKRGEQATPRELYLSVVALFRSDVYPLTWYAGFPWSIGEPIGEGALKKSGPSTRSDHRSQSLGAWSPSRVLRCCFMRLMALEPILDRFSLTQLYA
jgi:hypothetical protein